MRAHWIAMVLCAHLVAGCDPAPPEVEVHGVVRAFTSTGAASDIPPEEAKPCQVIKQDQDLINRVQGDIDRAFGYTGPPINGAPVPDCTNAAPCTVTVRVEKDGGKRCTAILPFERYCVTASKGTEIKFVLEPSAASEFRFVDPDNKGSGDYPPNVSEPASAPVPEPGIRLYELRESGARRTRHGYGSPYFTNPNRASDSEFTYRSGDTGTADASRASNPLGKPPKVVGSVREAVMSIAYVRYKDPPPGVSPFCRPADPMMVNVP